MTIHLVMTSLLKTDTLMYVKINESCPLGQKVGFSEMITVFGSEPTGDTIINPSVGFYYCLWASGFVCSIQQQSFTVY